MEESLFLPLNSVINLRQLLKNKNFNKRLIKGGNSLRRLGNSFDRVKIQGVFVV